MSQYIRALIENKVVQEVSFQIDKGSKLIIKPNVYTISVEGLEAICDKINNELESDKKVIAIPHWLDLVVLNTK